MSNELKKIVEWFLSQQSMSPKKLQKMLYYAQAWCVTLSNETSEEIENKLFDDKFEAWVHGPVIPEVYQTYKKYGYNNIPKIDENIQLEEDIEDVLIQVMDVYGNFNGNQLENITHQEKPWIDARIGYSPLENCNEIITEEEMFDYYIKQAN
ncbi:MULTISPECIES: Panacea domain-containing protein [Staphylococcus]|uniref:Phage-associated protein n=1 Tax=Staphylococcus carnosus (strain TM300) TaxID=396513 RepID=B9DMN0_STACT|nr:type II toxin-antitoxin system antitoxin SocA domain-containing protein [Staphylococcus carnosus]QPT04529.1 SocA family protein [Staphylococcus carnosus]UQA67254.1 DUF4065 domain-containing protein [Staphylococcus carnosus]UTB77912.1 hypothetical protein A2I62_04745 [Staphylococcus carnosus]UTB87457.1 hypothetical protein A2I63_04735 [Staphylococcus carnosus]UTB89808.1 hypothetical protein A2I64_04740 [Staphylococcus carnosus]